MCPYQFVADGYYTGGWDDTLFEKQRAELISRLNTAKDIDLVIACGTLAGQAMATDDHRTPTVILTSTDAVMAGIIPSPEDSGRDYIFAMIELNRYYREVALFHNIFAFKRLGIAYEDTEQGRPSAALPQIRRAAKELGVELVECTAPFNFVDSAPATANLIACHERLVNAGKASVHHGFEGFQKCPLRSSGPLQFGSDELLQDQKRGFQVAFHQAAHRRILGKDR